jgi:hypothetical protein
MRTEIGITYFIFFKMIISPDNVLLCRVNGMDAAYICFHGSGMLHWRYSACYLLMIWIIYPRFNSLHLTCLFRCCTYTHWRIHIVALFFCFSYDDYFRVQMALLHDVPWFPERTWFGLVIYMFYCLLNWCCEAQYLSLCRSQFVI